MFANVSVHDDTDVGVDPVTSTHGISEPGRRSVVERMADVGYIV